MKIAIIIITYNSQHTIEKCLRSVLESKDNFEKRIYLIDNNSTDNTRDLIIKYEANPNIKITFNRENTGFAGGINQGFELSGDFAPDFYFLLNPDAEVTPDCLSQLIMTAKKDTSLGLIAPKIIDPVTQKSWFDGGRIDWLRFRAVHDKNYASETQFLTGCALLIRKEVIQKIGNFDENFFLYYEDDDYSLRALKAGFKLKMVGEALCYHSESQSFLHSSNSSVHSRHPSRSKDYHLTKSAMIFFRKHYPVWALGYFWLMLWTRFLYHKFFSKKQIISRALLDSTK